MNGLVFVYGTLKSGHRNAHVNTGRRVPGEFVTVESFPLFVIGATALPWLVDSPGEGLPVVGELFEVDADGLARLDRLERITEPAWYTRGEVLVRPRAEPLAPPRRAWVYFGDRERAARETVHAGPLPEYTLAHAAAWRP